MALELSQTATILSQQVNIQQQVILEIDGISKIFGAVEVTKLVRVGRDDLTIGSDWKIGGLISDPDQLDYINLAGTSSNVRQQIEVDRGGQGSVSKYRIKLVDKNAELSALFRPGNEVDDVISRECKVYLGFQGGSHPEDSVLIFNGICDELNFGSGYVELVVAHPEQIKRQDIFALQNSALDGAIDSVTTSINLDSTAGLIIPTDIQRSFIRIDDEIIEFTGISGNSLTGVVRASLGTAAASHDDEVETSSFYTITGEAIEIALKLMISTSEEFFVSGQEIRNFVQVTTTDQRPNTILLDSLIFESEQGIVLGDLVTTTGALSGSNNVSAAPITSIDRVENGTVITLGGVSLVQEVNSPAALSIKSQYNVLNEGLGMNPRFVDVKQHVAIDDLLRAQIPSYEFYLEDTVDGQSFISSEVYFPAGLYQLPRGGRASVAATVPPLQTGSTPVLDEMNVLNPDKLKPSRTINKYFYNAVVYRYNRDPIQDKFTSGDINLSARSTNRLGVGTKSLTITSLGLRASSGTREFTRRQAARFLDRYQFAAETIEVEVNYSTGFPIEPGDTLFFGSTALQVTDLNSGTRDFAPRLFEVINKDLNIKTGKIKLKLLDTKFGNDSRIGVVSPSSKIDLGSTTTTIRLKKSFGTGEFGVERDKYADFIGQKLLIHSPDYSFQEEVTLEGFPAENESEITVSALSSSPSEDYFVEIGDYSTSTDPKDGAIYKDQFVYFNPQVTVVSGTSTTVTVDPSDIDKFFIGSFCRIHTPDFSSQSITLNDDPDLEITDITGNVLTFDRAIGYTPSSGDLIDLIGFKENDKGLPYRIF